MLRSFVIGLCLATLGLSVHAGGTIPGTATRPMVVTPPFRRFGQSDGLPGSAINAVVQDRQGYLWFGGTGGLSRYDGVEFKTYSHQPDQPDSFGGIFIDQLVAAPDGRLWIGTGDAGLDRLDPRTGKFEHWRHDPKHPGSLSGDIVYALAQTVDGTLWVGTDHGLDRLTADGRQIVHVALPQDLRDGYVSALLAEQDGSLWIGTSSGVLARQMSDGSIRRYTLGGPHRAGTQIWRIEGGGGDVRVGTRYGLLRVTGGRAEPLYDDATLPPDYAFDSARDTEGRLWIATVHGVILDDPRSGLHRFHSQSLLVGGMPGEWTWRVLVDREGGVWFTFYDGGVAYLAPGWSSFTRYTHVPDDPQSLRDTLASSLEASLDDKLWVAQRGGIDKLDPRTGKVEHVVDGVKGEITSMLENTQGLWFVSRGALKLFAHGRLTTIDPQHKWIDRPLYLSNDAAGFIYVTVARYGLLRIDPRDQSIVPVPFDPQATDIDQLSLINEIHDGVPWYSDHEGLLHWSARHQRMEFVPGVRRGDQVNALAFDMGGFWLARSDVMEHYRWRDGLARLDRAIGGKQGWRGAVVSGLWEGRGGELWILSMQGLWRFDPAGVGLKRFGMQNGFLNSEFTSSPIELSEPGRIYALTQGGVLSFQPDRLHSDQTAPPLVIQSLSSRGDYGERRLLSSDGTVRLGWRDRELKVVARALSYSNPAANRYRFLLEGFDQHWVDVGTRGEREFSGLPAGEYTLWVSAATAGSDWSPAPLSLHIVVPAPPWARWWAWLIYLLLLALASLLGLRHWRRRLSQRHAFQLAEQSRSLAEQANAAKTLFLATLSHEIRTPMTGVLGMAELLLATGLDQQQHAYAETIQRSGDLLLRLVNDALDLARIEAGRMSLERTAFSPRELLDEVGRLQRPGALAKGLQFHLDISERLPPWLTGDVLRLRQIVLNLAGNAQKFTERGSVTVAADYEQGELLLSVSDTGPGIPEGAQARLFLPFEQGTSPQRPSGSGLGLAICRELAALMGGSIELESRVAFGSTFRVRLPLPASSAPTNMSAKAPAPPHEDGMRHVLLVEDDAIVAAVIRGLLDAQGHSVVYAGHGLAALAELSRQNFDVMLLDLDLPGLDGYQLARIVRQRQQEWRLPIIAISARSDGDEERRCGEAGIDGFLRKPLSGERLAQALFEFATGKAPASLTDGEIGAVLTRG